MTKNNEPVSPIIFCTRSGTAIPYSLQIRITCGECARARDNVYFVSLFLTLMALCEIICCIQRVFMYIGMCIDIHSERCLVISPILAGAP